MFHFYLVTQKIISDTYSIQALKGERQGFVYTRKRVLWTFTISTDNKTLAPNRVMWGASFEIPAFLWRMILLKLKCVFEHTPSCLPHKAALVACSIALMVFVEGYEGQRIDWCLTFWSRPVYTVYLVQLCCFDHCRGCIPRLRVTIEALISSYFDELSMPDRLDILRKMFEMRKAW